MTEVRNVVHKRVKKDELDSERGAPGGKREKEIMVSHIYLRVLINSTDKQNTVL